EVLREMQSDMRIVHGRLGRGNVDPLTLAIQKDIDETLDEFVRALTRPLARGEKPPTARSITDTFPTILPDLCAIDEILFRAQKTQKPPQKRCRGRCRSAEAPVRKCRKRSILPPCDR